MLSDVGNPNGYHRSREGSVVMSNSYRLNPTVSQIVVWFTGTLAHTSATQPRLVTILSTKTCHQAIKQTTKKKAEDEEKEGEKRKTAEWRSGRRSFFLSPRSWVRFPQLENVCVMNMNVFQCLDICIL
ncbi:jg1923 [Pararge aegeria aegeria]|uniref:Jg1923 protein n=1 Tax=Pararge aegeria aegeria TaxID=348720 RepID=A0A8S4R348_9NEOP|nr:jg1923 [Pararge aegeria aegeria]